MLEENSKILSDEYLLILEQKALKICMEKHGEAKRRFSPEPYYIHPMSVAFMVKRYGKVYSIVGLLHDVIEDTDMKLEDLIAEGFPENIVDAVEAITHREKANESYDDYMIRVKKNPIARLVKIADMLHNLQDFHLYGKDDQVKKICKQMLFLSYQD